MENINDTKKEVVGYKLVKDGKTVYYGTTNNPRARAAEHKLKGKTFDKLVVLTGKMNRPAAENVEKKLISAYKSKNRINKRPSLNKTDDGKFQIQKKSSNNTSSYVKSYKGRNSKRNKLK